MILNQKDKTVEYDNSEEAKDKAFFLLLEFFLKHQTFDGESLHQCDGPQLDAMNILSALAKKAFKFKVKYKDE